MIDVAQSCRPSDFSTRVLRGRMRELSGDVAGSLADYDPGSLEVGPGAFEVFRRGQSLRRRDPQEAERLFRLALEAEPRFSLAYRAYADSIRSRRPQEAAAHYLAAMAHMPLLHHGGANAGAGFLELRVLGSYRNFLLTMKGKTYVAYPVASGAFDLSSEHLTSVPRRLAGLFLLRLRFRNKAVGQMGESAPVPQPPPRWRKRLWRLRVKNRLARRALKHRLAGDNPPAVARFGGTVLRWIAVRLIHAALRLRMRIRWRRRRLNRSIGRILDSHADFRRQAARWFIGWAGRNYHLFQFVLIGDTLEDLKGQIDLVYDRWLTTARE
jgi:hypothetical protein